MSFSFASPSSAPASTGLGFSFGANKPATPGFGLTATSQPSTGLFGSTPATSAPAFGTTTPSFGASGFGQGTSGAFGSTTPAFGAGTNTSFGATSSAPAFGAGTTPGFGATSTAPTFGATSAAPAFGATTTPAFGTSAAPAFGSTTTPAFGANTSGFGTGLGTGGLNFGAGSNTSTAATGLTFGAPTTSAGLGGLGGFGIASTQSTGLGGGLFGTTTSTSSLFGPKLGTTTVTSTQPSVLGGSVGLGGLAPLGTNTTISGDGKTEPPKQTKLPNEISSTVDSFKEMIKKQKSLSSEIMRVSTKPLHKVSREAEVTLRAVLSLSGEVSRARAHARRLRASAAAAVAAADAVAAAPVSEVDGSAPPAYVKELISELEQQLAAFRRQMDAADRQMAASPKPLTEHELKLGMRRMHESLVALAGRLQAVHSLVNEQKERYLALRRHLLHDTTDVFQSAHSSSSLDEILWDAEGSRKKSKSGHNSDLSDAKTVLGNLEQLAGPSPFIYTGNMLSPYPSADTSGVSWQPQSQQQNISTIQPPAVTTDSFQLQKPPGKRGKQ